MLCTQVVPRGTGGNRRSPQAEVPRCGEAPGPAGGLRPLRPRRAVLTRLSAADPSPLHGPAAQVEGRLAQLAKADTGDGALLPPAPLRWLPPGALQPARRVLQNPFTRGVLLGAGLTQPLAQWREVRLAHADKAAVAAVLEALQTPWPSSEATLWRHYDPEVVLTDPWLGHVVGREALMQQVEYLRRTCSFQARWDTVLHGDGVHMVRGELRLQGPLGLATQVPISCHFEMRAGRIVAQHNHYDRLGALLSLVNLAKKAPELSGR
ncbi:MAG: hypothetical protein EOO40_01400 [Deltaproteobacteria bacterium]|nr:MAG: hypothetical protein EOO40_01400 [Deltaproteobacteria bacterium]